MHHSPVISSRRRSLGMSLIEIMVGLAIALVTTLVIFEVFSTSMASNRTTSSGNEAQISGGIGMFQLERDLKVAGMGFGTLTQMSAAGVPCNVNAINPALTPATFSFPLVPVVITPGAGPVPDQIDVLYGNSAYMTAGRTYQSGSLSSKITVSRGGIHPGDLAVLTDPLLPPTVCEMVEITSDANTDGLTVNHVQGAGYTNFYSGAAVVATRNSAGTPATLNGTGRLYNLGPQPTLNQWRVVNTSLGLSNLFSSGVASPVAEGIVNLKAQYGVDTSTTTPPAGVVNSWTTTAPVNWSQVLAIRFALLARSSQLEKSPVTAVAPTWVGGSFDMSAIPNWQNYRYRVYESVVAMRNLIWGTSP